MIPKAIGPSSRVQNSISKENKESSEIFFCSMHDLLKKWGVEILDSNIVKASRPQHTQALL